MAAIAQGALAPPPPPPPELEPPPELLELEDEELEELDELLLEDDEELLDEDELLLELLELEELDDDEELELLLEDEEPPRYSSAPMSYAKPVGRVSPSMSTVKPEIAVPELTTPLTAEARCRSQLAGAVNQPATAELLFVAVATAGLLEPVTALLARLFLTFTTEVQSLYSIALA